MILDQVFEAIRGERAYQDVKWGPRKPQSLPGFLLVMRTELDEAEIAWAKNQVESRHTPLEEILQVVTVGIRCLEKYGVEGSARATDDITEYQMHEERMDRSEKRFGAR